MTWKISAYAHKDEALISAAVSLLGLYDLLKPDLPEIPFAESEREMLAAAHAALGAADRVALVADANYQCERTLASVAEEGLRAEYGRIRAAIQYVRTRPIDPGLPHFPTLVRADRPNQAELRLVVETVLTRTRPHLPLLHSVGLPENALDTLQEGLDQYTKCLQLRTAAHSALLEANGQRDEARKHLIHHLRAFHHLLQLNLPAQKHVLLEGIGAQSFPRRSPKRRKKREADADSTSTDTQGAPVSTETDS
jgi:hypothetical protein